MVAPLTYRDSGEWGAGQGSNLNGPQVDMNFWILFSAIQALEDHALTTQNQIDYFSVVGNQLFVTMMDHVVFGPYVLPTAQWNYRGLWLPDTRYSTMDVIINDGSLYLCTNGPFTSASTFNAGANVGPGENCYALLLAAPPNELPDNGITGQVPMIGESPNDIIWTTLTRNIGVFIEGYPSDSQIILQYAVPEAMTLPVNLTGSIGYVGTDSTTTQTYGLFQNGASIGSVVFTGGEAAFSFTAAVHFVPNDILTLVAPSDVDPHMTDISITLVATLP